MYFSWEVYLDSKFVAGSIYLYHIFAYVLYFIRFLYWFVFFLVCLVCECVNKTHAQIEIIILFKK